MQNIIGNCFRVRVSQNNKQKQTGQDNSSGMQCSE